MLAITVLWLAGTAALHCVFISAIRKEHRDVSDLTFCLAILLMAQQAKSELNQPVLEEFSNV